MTLFAGNEETRKSYEAIVLKYFRADFLRETFGSPENVQANAELANQLLNAEDKRLKKLVSELSDQELWDTLKTAETHISKND